MKRAFGLIILVAIFFASCKKDSRISEIIIDDVDAYIEDLPINKIQSIGSHNSYRIRTDEDIFNLVNTISGILPNDLNPQGWDYTQIPITDQLELGLRNFELDIFYDPSGRRYYERLGNTLVGRDVKSGIEELRSPGIKLMHIPDFDYNTHHYTFKDAIQTIKDWSGQNPTHLPIIILVEFKEFGVGNVLPIFKKVLPFNAKAVEDVEQEVIDIFGINNSQLFKPDDLRGEHPDLKTAIETDGWPAIREMRGKIILVCYENANYTRNHPNLEGRMMFQFSKINSRNAAFVKIDGSDNIEEINNAVASGAMVRTRADANTDEARTGETTKRENAFLSGAQIISTDYYIPDARAGQPGWTDFKVIFPNGKYSRVNVLNTPNQIKGLTIEE